jgi:hypothetical protein
MVYHWPPAVRYQATIGESDQEIKTAQLNKSRCFRKLFTVNIQTYPEPVEGISIDRLTNENPAEIFSGPTLVKSGPPKFFPEAYRFGEDSLCADPKRRWRNQ